LEINDQTSKINRFVTETKLEPKYVVRVEQPIKIKKLYVDTTLGI